jgi:hypothetical protein
VGGGWGVAPIQPFRPALGAESRVCYPGYAADRQPQWALTFYYRSQSTANLNEKLIHCYHWGSTCDFQPIVLPHYSIIDCLISRLIDLNGLCL